MPPVTGEVLMRTGQVARLFGVDPTVVRKWADARRLTVTHTLGGHRRFQQAEVLAFLAERQTQAEVA